MNSPLHKKIVPRQMILISALILLGANTVLAANRVADAQTQAGDLLAGTVGGRSKMVDKSAASWADSHRPSYPDPQTQARQLLVGKSEVQPKSAIAVPALARRIGYAHPDPQDLARRMILGPADKQAERRRTRTSNGAAHAARATVVGQS